MSGQNGQAEEENAPEDAASPTRDLYKEKPVSKLVRVLTVLAYLLSVSMAAILLSVYYVCVWKSPALPPINETSQLSARQGDLNDYEPVAVEYMNSTGGGHSSVSDITTEPSTSNTTVFTNATTSSIFDSNSTYDPSVHRDSIDPESQTVTILDDIGAINETDTVT